MNITVNDRGITDIKQIPIEKDIKDIKVNDSNSDLNSIDKIFKFSESAKSYKYPAFSFVHCVNYSFGIFDKIVYGAPVLSAIKTIFAVIDVPLYFKKVRQIYDGELFKVKRFKAVKLVVDVTYKTLSYVTKIYEISLSYFFQMTESTIPYFVPLKRVTNTLGSASSFLLSIDLGMSAMKRIKKMQDGEEDRSLKNITTLVSTVALSVFMFGWTWKISVMMQGPGIILNISTVAGFILQHL